jgi:hypothetical protein
MNTELQLDPEERALAELHGLDNDQIRWRRVKINEMGVHMFCREYPLNASECFVAANFDSYIPAELVMEARKKTDNEVFGELVLGVDPAHHGPDSTAICWRRGHYIVKIEKRQGLDTMQTAGWVASIIREEKPAQVNIDATGVGAGVVDRLIELGYGDVVNRVHFGGKPLTPAALDERGRPGGGFANRRAEMWNNLKMALEEGSLKLPDSDSLMSDLCCVGYSYQSSGALLLESKKDIKKRGFPSPDQADALALCFSNPISERAVTRVANFNREIGAVRLTPC